MRSHLNKFLGSHPGATADFTKVFVRETRGAIAIVFGIILFLLVATVGVALDYARASRARSDLAGALDAAVLAAASVAEADRQSVGHSFFNANFHNREAGNVSVAFVTQTGGAVVGTATGNVKTTMAKALRVDAINIGATATSGQSATTTTTSTTTTVTAGKVCVLLLDPTTPQALLVNSGAVIAAPACEIHVWSAGGPAAIFNAGSTIATAKICIKGSAIIDNGGTHPNLVTSCTPSTDPFVGTLPAPASATCSFSNMNYSGTVNLSPGVYCGWTNFNASTNVTFAPGVYVIKGGGWNVNGGTFKGTGVTFYFSDTSHIQFNSGIDSQLYAPTSGPYSGLLMFEKEGLSTSPFVWDDAIGSDMEGLIYLPSRDATFNSHSKVSAEKLTMVFKTLIVDDTNWEIASSSMVIPGSSSSTTVSTTTTVPGAVILER